MDVKMEGSWKEALKAEFKKPYFEGIVKHLKTEKSQGKTIYPAGSNIFHAFTKTPFNQVKVVILGQDPYHGPGQAHGLSFSVPQGIPIPPSLMNIFKEIQQDIGVPFPQSGNLEPWAEQGVLLLNASLTVPAGEPMSHARIGWAIFTDTVIRTLSEKKEKLVFLLWGKFAREKKVLIDNTRHLILEAAHPSPLSAHNGFLGCGHFSKTNDYLMKNGIDPVDWGGR